MELLPEGTDREGRKTVTLKDIIKWLTDETSCYAQDVSSDTDNPAILVDGVLYLKDIKELARRVKELDK